MKRTTIGRAAALTRVNVETIRFYERRGLIAQPPRPTDGGSRDYGREVIDRILFIRQAQDIGFSLREVADLLALRNEPGADCAEIRVRTQAKRDEVQAKLGHLTRLRDALDLLIANCPGKGALDACTILEAMAHRSGTSAKHREQSMETTTLKIEGMHCRACARTVQAVLQRATGVLRAEASFDKRQARILHDPQKAGAAELAALIEDCGYAVEILPPQANAP